MESIDTYDKYKQSLTHPYTMIKATASWCSPCKKIHPQVVELSNNEKYNSIHFYEYDIDEIDDCPLQEFIRVVPTFLFFEQKKLVHTIKGTDMLGVTNYLEHIVNKINSSTNLDTLEDVSDSKDDCNESEENGEQNSELNEKQSEEQS